MKRQILITGATGHIGSRLASEALRERHYDRVVLLVRGESDAHARERVMRVIESAEECSLPGEWIHRLDVMAGDIQRPDLGMARWQYDRLASSVTHIVHSAADTSFVQTYESAHAVNCDGTANVIALAERCRIGGVLQRVACLSTAYVNSPSGRAIAEDSLDTTPPSHNAYDISKWESERFLRSYFGRLPLMIFRPSIVVGDSITGYTNSFNVMYVPLRYIWSGRARVLPGRAGTGIDLVPVDYIAGAVLRILVSGDTGRTYHLVAGRRNRLSMAEMIAAVRELGRLLGREIPPVRTIDAPVKSAPIHSDRPDGDRVFRALSLFAPYMANEWDFDDANTRAALRGSGLRCPHPTEYFDRLLAFCLGCDWGRAVRQVA